MKPKNNIKNRKKQNQYHLSRKLRQSIFFSLSGFIFGIVGVLVMIVFFSPTRNQQSSICSNSYLLPETESTFQKNGTLEAFDYYCLEFKANSTSRLYLDTNIKSILQYPDGNQDKVIGQYQTNLSQPGLYKIILLSRSQDIDYQLGLNLINESNINEDKTQTSSASKVPEETENVSLLPKPQSHKQLIYNVKSFNKQENIYNHKQLQQIVNGARFFLEQRGFSSETLSISLIDLTRDPCCAYASYQDEIQRFPASVVKLFWIVAYYAQEQAGWFTSSTISESNLYKMINKSDNEVASDVVDMVTNTRSEPILSDQKFNVWLNNRYWINRFFEGAGYMNINLTQKNFPIPKLNLMNPSGVDLKMRIKDGDIEPIRNHLSTYQVARLLYEIETEQAVSPLYSQKIKGFMKRNLDPNHWRSIQYNSVEGFFPEFLPIDAQVFSKVGWYSGSRQDAAIIYSPDGRVRYILVIFGEDKHYAEDWEIFSELSRFIYDQMLSLYSYR